MAMPMNAPVAASEATMPDTITVPKSVLGDKECKPGDTLNFKVVDVDPETGDAEVTMSGYSHANGGEGGESVGDEMASYPMET